LDQLHSLAQQSGLLHLSWQAPVMWLVAVVFLYLGIKKGIEPLLMIPIGFSVLLVNMPLGGLMRAPDALEPFPGLFRIVMDYGIRTDVVPCLIFLGLGAMTDFGPVIANPKTLLLGAAAQFGVFVAFLGALLLGYDLQSACSIGIIGGADGPTAIFTATSLGVPDAVLGACAISAYSYMAMVPIIQPPIIKLLTSKAERGITMKQLRPVSKTEKLVFPVLGALMICLLVPKATPLIGLFMLGNLFMVSGVVDRLRDAARNEIMNVVTIFLGIGVGSTMIGEQFLTPRVLGIYALGLVAFSFSTAGGLLFAKLMNLFLKQKINPLIGSAGVSAVPMAARVSHQLASEANPKSYILMHAMGPNVAGVIGTVVAAGIFIALAGRAESAPPPAPETPVAAPAQHSTTGTTE
jgi:carboxybiotin decarboxylase